MKAQLTIIVPVYNEVLSLPHLIRALDQYLKFTPMDSRILMVDDGSTDNSLKLIKQICKENSGQYGYVSLKYNQGLSAALKIGISQVNTPLVGYLDADLQTNPKDFMRYFSQMEGYGMVNGIRSQRNDHLIKKISSKIANSFRRMVLNDGIEDTCCPLKIIQLKYARGLPFFKGMHRFIPALVQIQGGRVRQIEIPHYSRIAGSPKYHLFNRLLGPFIDTLVVWWMKRNWISEDLIAEKSRIQDSVNDEISTI